jgi:hypothetical protein
MKGSEKPTLEPHPPIIDRIESAAHGGNPCCAAPCIMNEGSRHLLAFLANLNAVLVAECQKARPSKHFLISSPHSARQMNWRTGVFLSRNTHILAIWQRHLAERGRRRLVDSLHCPCEFCTPRLNGKGARP